MNKAKKTKPNKIDPNKWYDLKEIYESGYFSHLRTSLPGISNLVNKDKANRDLLKTAILGEGRNRRYRIKGRNIIEFLVNIEDGSYPL